MPRGPFRLAGACPGRDPEGNMISTTIRNRQNVTISIVMQAPVPIGHRRSVRPPIPRRDQNQADKKLQPMKQAAVDDLIAGYQSQVND